jgi:hypothetical protein
VAQLVESLTAVAGGPTAPVFETGAMSEARTCYDHLAGRLGVGVYGALVDAGAMTPTSEVRGDVLLGPAAEEAFGELGIDPGAVAEKSGRRRFAFACPDWTERLPHPWRRSGGGGVRTFLREGYGTPDRGHAGGGPHG